MSMTSRERVLAAINHREPDRVPLDLGGTGATGIHVSAYVRLRQALGLGDEDPKVGDVWQMLAWVEDPVVEKLGVDVLTVRTLSQPFGLRNDRWRSWRLDDGTPVQMPANFAPVAEADGSLCLYSDGELVAKKARTGVYFDRMIEFKVYDPLPPVGSFKIPLFTDEDLAWRRRWAETLRRETDKALIGEFGMILGRWGSYQEWMYTIGANPDYVRAFYDRKIEIMLANLQLYAQAVGDNIDIFALGEDFGTQKGLMISPRMFREMVAPYYKRLFDWVHRNTSWKVHFHCCGGIYPIIGTLIDCGVDILNPVQTSAAGMEPEKLKQEFGDKLVFWGGGIETQSVFPYGTLDEVRAQVRERLRIFGPGGGFVFCPIHNIRADVSTDQMLAMYEALREYGTYPV
ncbi:MAG: methyltransferase [Chloroflexi bacterium]|nr:methyltransferase [Chloroflexota bacterium]